MGRKMLSIRAIKAVAGCLAGILPVSYTHLDVYKRQVKNLPQHYKGYMALFHAQNTVKAELPLSAFHDKAVGIKQNNKRHKRTDRHRGCLLYTSSSLKMMPVFSLL